MATITKNKVRVKYIPTSDSYRGLKLPASISTKGQKTESVVLEPGVWAEVSPEMAAQLKRKLERMRRGVHAPDGANLEGRMQSVTEKGLMRHDSHPDFELIIEGE